MGSATSVLRPGFDLGAMTAAEVAGALSADPVLAPYATRALERGVSGAVVAASPPATLADALGIADGDAARRLGDTVATARKSATDARVRSSMAACGMADVADVRASSGGLASGVGAESVGIASDADTPRGAEGGRVAPDGAPAVRKSLRCTSAALRRASASPAAPPAGDAAGGAASAPGSPGPGARAPPPAAARAGKDAPPPAAVDYDAEAANIEALKALASGGESDSLVARIIEEVSGDYDGTDRDEFEALFAKFGLFQTAGTRGLRDQLFAMFDRDGDGKIAVAEMAGALAIFHGGDKVDRLRLIFRVYDEDGSGAVEREELGRLMRSIVVDTRKMVRAALEWEQDLVAAVGADLASTKIDAHALGGAGGRVSLLEVEDGAKHGAKKAPRSKKKKGKKAKAKKTKTADGAAAAAAAGPPRVRIRVDGAAGKLDLDVAKEDLLKLLDDDAPPEIEERLLDALVEDCLAHNDIDHDESLSFEEFAGWAGGSQLVDEMLSHLHVFDRTPWHEQRSAKDRGITRLGGPVTKPTAAVAKLAEAERATAARAAVAGPSYDAS